MNLKWLPIFICSILSADWQIPTPRTVLHPETESCPVSSPLTYPDEAGFQERVERAVAEVAPGSLQKWRTGYFSGGDPGKYLPGHAMAKLLADPEDPEPAEYLNDNRSYKEHYHFAAVNWARFLPIFGESVLTAETQKRLAKEAFTYGSYLNSGGTENHRTMWWTSANVLPLYLKGGLGLSHQNKTATLAEAKRQLHDYVKGLYVAGSGEWDSSTYTMFTMNGLMNIYDFAEDPEVRLLARAGLDLLAASYAQKYTNGIFAGPNQRGFPKAPYRSIADQTGFLWWGNTDNVEPGQLRNAYYAMHAATSSWRPNRVITRIARREGLPFPVEQRNSKANYWHGQQIPPRPGASHESVYLTENFTLGSLWNAHASQHSRFNIVTREGMIFSGGHPRRSDHTGKRIELGFQDGSGRYIQSAQAGPLYLAMARWPEDEEAAYTFFSHPEDLAPEVVGDWRVFDTGSTVVAVRPVSRSGQVETDRAEHKKQVTGLLKFPSEDQQSGFLVWVGDRTILSRLDEVKVEFDPTESSVRVKVPGVHVLDFRFQPDPDGTLHGNRSAEVRIDGEEVDLSAWPIYGGPLLQQTPGLVRISDGQDSFTIDFRGDLPKYLAE